MLLAYRYPEHLSISALWADEENIYGMSILLPRAIIDLKLGWLPQPQLHFGAVKRAHWLEQAPKPSCGRIITSP